MADNVSISGPKSTFEAYRAEGDMLFKQLEFTKAIESYNNALELRQEDKNCLVARSRCYLHMGDTDNALKDAEVSMHEDPSFFKGMLCKADALYFKGEFETALVFYHRGNRLRPEQHEFRLGIQKCREAIENSVGSPEKVKLHKEGDLSYFYKPLEEETAKKRKQQQSKALKRNNQPKQINRPVSSSKDKTIKELLGSLYADREYLEKLLKEEAVRLDELHIPSKYNSMRDYEPSGKFVDDSEVKVYSEKYKNKKIVLSENQKPKKKRQPFEDEDGEDKHGKEKTPKEKDAKEKKTETSEAIQKLALDGLMYLDTRTDFWRQQKPMYARKRDQEMQHAKITKKGNDPARYIIQKLKEIDEAHTKGKYKDVLKEANKSMKLVESWNDDDISNKKELLASLHSSMGNAYLELKEYENALKEHQADLQIARDIENEELESRAMDNLGRVYARIGRFSEAIEIWEEKINKKPDMQDLEAAWVFHELGRCYLESDKVAEALEYGEKSYSHARVATDEVWQLHSSVLIAQAQVKNGNYEEAIDLFERALDFAKLQEDNDSIRAIKKAINEVNDKIVSRLSDPEARNKGDDNQNEQENGDQRFGDKEADEEGDEYNEDFQEFEEEGGELEEFSEKSDQLSPSSKGCKISDKNEPHTPITPVSSPVSLTIEENKTHTEPNRPDQKDLPKPDAFEDQQSLPEDNNSVTGSNEKQLKSHSLEEEETSATPDASVDPKSIYGNTYPLGDRSEENNAVVQLAEELIRKAIDDHNDSHTAEQENQESSKEVPQTIIEATVPATNPLAASSTDFTETSNHEKEELVRQETASENPGSLSPSKELKSSYASQEKMHADGHVDTKGGEGSSYVPNLSKEILENESGKKALDNETCQHHTAGESLVLPHKKDFELTSIDSAMCNYSQNTGDTDDLLQRCSGTPLEKVEEIIGNEPYEYPAAVDQRQIEGVIATSHHVDGMEEQIVTEPNYSAAKANDDMGRAICDGDTPEKEMINNFATENELTEHPKS